MFDEPVNGLDPEGILWIRNLMKRRGTVYAAKAAVLAAVTLVVSLLTSFGTYFLGRVLLASTRHRAAVRAGGSCGR